MKIFTSLLCTVFASVNFLFAQCTPNVVYANDTVGFYPLSTVDCGFTFNAISDTLVNFEIVPGNPTPFTLYLDAFKITSISNIPAGISATTDVINSADLNAPYGYWFNTGNVPNQNEVLGCMSFTEAGVTFASLASSGPNSNGTFPITIEFDMRIAGSNPDMSAIIQNGSWMSTVPASLGGGFINYERILNVNSCLTQGPCTPPSVLFAGLNTSYTTADSPGTLIGAPSGGSFFGNGISGDQFDPASAGVGSHGITYVYVDNDNCMNAYSLCTTVALNVGIGGTEIASTEGLDVYPNPSSGLFTLSVNDMNGIVSYSVYDALGKEVANDAFVSNGITRNSIDLSEMADGIYTIQVNSSKGVFSEKLVKE